MTDGDGGGMAISGRRSAIKLAVTLGALLCGLPPVPARAQETVDVSGIVLDVATGQGIPDVILRVLGTDVSAASDEDGNFVIRDVPPGTWILRVDHVAYGTREHEFSVTAGMSVRLEVRLAEEAIELEPLVVETQTTRQRAQRAQGSSLNLVERPEIERALGTSKHLGDLIRQTIPGIRLRQTNNLAGTDVCLEFRAAATISLVNRRPCNHPMVLLDGVVVSDPNYLYGTIGLANVERIQVIPPGEAGARYGTGSLYGVILIDTRPPGSTGLMDDRPMRPPVLRPSRVSFDWTQDPDGHPVARAGTGAFLGNALGLAAGIALGQRCIAVDDKDQIVTSCGGVGNAAAVMGAIALPALGAALGSRWGGGTENSVGRFLPAMVGAGMMIFPGYAFSMSTVGGGSHAANAVGNALLVVGAPLVVTLADRLFRNLR